MARLLRQARLLGVAFFCALGLLVVGVQPAAARQHCWSTTTTLSVRTAVYTTIRAAIAAASPGAAIQVCAGTYPELAPGPLLINKIVTLRGRPGRAWMRGRGPARNRPMTDIQGTSVSASNVVIDGFTVQDSSLSAFTGFGIWINPGVSGTQIVNNIIQDNIVGIGLANNGLQAVIRHNLIQNNNRPGGASGRASTRRVRRRADRQERADRGEHFQRPRGRAASTSATPIPPVAPSTSTSPRTLRHERPGLRALQHPCRRSTTTASPTALFVSAASACSTTT